MATFPLVGKADLLQIVEPFVMERDGAFVEGGGAADPRVEVDPELVAFGPIRLRILGERAATQCDQHQEQH